MKIIKLSEDHYIVVDDSEIKQGDWMYNSDREPSMLQCIGKGSLRGWQKITHSTNIDWNEVYYISLSEVKELIGEVDVEKKAKNHLDEQHNNEDIAHPELYDAYHSFLKGYNECSEDNKEKKWTDEDVIRIVEKSRQTGLTAEYLMLSLYSQTEWEVEFVDGKLKLKNT